VFGTIRVADDLRVFVKLTRFIVGTERRERTFVLTAETPQALARQLARSAREMFDVQPAGEDGAAAEAVPDEPARRRRKPPKTQAGDEPADPLEEGPRRPAKSAARDGDGPTSDAATDAPIDAPAPGRRGRITLGTYLLITGGAMALVVGTGFAVAGSELSDDAANARKTTPDDTRRIAAIERAARIRNTTGGILFLSGGVAVAGGVVRALLQRRPVDDGRAVSIVPVDGGAAIVLSDRLP